MTFCQPSVHFGPHVFNGVHVWRLGRPRSKYWHIVLVQPVSRRKCSMRRCPVLHKCHLAIMSPNKGEKTLLQSFILISHRINSAVKNNQFAPSLGANSTPHHDAFSPVTVVWNAWQRKPLIDSAVDAEPSIMLIQSKRFFI